MVHEYAFETDDGEPISVGVVGAGHISRLFHLPILANHDQVNISFVADIDADKAKRLTTTYSARAIVTGNPDDLPDCDVLLLSVPLGVREEYIESFVDRGAAVFSEKPFARTPAEHEQFVEKVPKIVCNYMRLNFHSTRQLRFLIQSDILGSLERIRATEGDIVGSTGKQEGHYQTDVSKSGGGLLIQNGCHLLSQLAFLVGDGHITVDTSRIKCHGPFDIDIDAELYVDDDIPVEVRISKIQDLPNRLELILENGTISVDPGNPAATVDLSTEINTQVDSVELNPSSQWATNLTQAHYLRWQAFLSWIEGESSEPPLRTGHRVTEIVESIYEQGGVVRDQ